MKIKVRNKTKNKKIKEIKIVKERGRKRVETIGREKTRKENKSEESNVIEKIFWL